MTGQGIFFDEVTKSYGGSLALIDFSLVVQPGEFMTLLGPSGSGKTTALNALAGFIEPDSGDIRVGDRSVIGLPPERRELGMVFQGYTLFPHMNVFDNIAFPLRLRRESTAHIKQKVERVLEMVQLSPFSKRMPRELSGGQQQRVAFARAVVSEPPVLLMDEPLAALDLKLRQQMQLEIKRYHAELGCTIIFVTHDQEEALVLSDRVAIMSDGQIRQVDTPDQIYDRPKSRYVAEFIGKTNILTYEQQGDGRGIILETGALVPAHTFQNRKRSLLSVRPEKISRRSDSANECAVFSAVLQEVLFLGNVVQYSVLLRDGSTLLFQEHRNTNRDPLEVKQQVELQFSLADALVIDEDVSSQKHEANDTVA